MKSKVHMMLHGKGGVGKSFINFVLAQYLLSHGEVPLCIDTDPVNWTFGSYKGLNVSKFDILEGRKVRRDRFDLLFNLIGKSNEGKDVVIDVGTSTYLPFLDYIISSDIPGLLDGIGRELVVHTVVTGGFALEATIKGTVDLVRLVPESVPVVVWLNPYWGPVERNGRWFEEFPEYKMVDRGEKTEILRMPEYPPLFQQDLVDMLRMRLTFDEALTSGRFWLLNLQRLVMIRRELFTLMDSLKSLSPSGADKKAREVAMEAPNVQAMIENIEKRYNVAVKAGDPIVAALAANDLILKRYDEATHKISDRLGAEVQSMLKDMTAKVEGLNATIEATSTKLVQDSKTAACVVGDAAVTVAKRELLEAGDEIGTKVRAMYNNVYSDIRFERWICIGAAVICVVFGLLGFMATGR